MDRAKTAAVGLQASLGGLYQAFLALGAVAAVSRLSGFVQETLDLADATGKAADRLGLTTDQVQAFETFAETAGSSARGMQTALRTLAKNAEDFRMGTGEAVDAFNELGLEVEGPNGQLRDLNSLTEDALVRLSQMTDETQKVAFAQRLFGRSGTELLPNLRGGAEAVRENLKAAREYGIVLDEAFIRKAEDANNQIAYFKRQMLGVRSTLINLFLPQLRESVVNLTRFLQGVRESVGGLGNLGDSFKSLGIIGVAAGILLLARNIGIVNKVLTVATRRLIPLILLFLAIEDFLGFLDGKKSVIGETLEALGLIDDAEKDGKALKETLKSWVPVIREVGETFQTFFKEALIGFGALVNAATASNEDMRADFLDVFARNTSTVNTFGETVVRILTAAPGVVAQAWATLVGGVSTLTRSMLSQTAAAATTIGAVFSRAVGYISALLTGFANLVDQVFGTRIANSVQQTSAQIQAWLTGAFSSASGVLTRLAQQIEDVGDTISDVITDPIGGAAKFFTGSTDAKFREDIRRTNERNRAFARQRQARATATAGGRTVTINDQRTVNIQTGAGGDTARGIARAVSNNLEADRGRTLSAVGGG
jgi:hypothetical protein